MNQVPYEVPGDLEVAIAGFAPLDYYNNLGVHLLKAAITKPLAT